MEENQNEINEDSIPIYGLEINDGINCPFAELYIDMFPELYDVE